MWLWIIAILIVDIIAGGIYTIKYPPRSLESPLTVLYILFWFLFVILDHQISKNREEYYERLKLSVIENTVPIECRTGPHPSSKCASCTSCPFRSQPTALK